MDVCKLISTDSTENDDHYCNFKGLFMELYDSVAKFRKYGAPGAEFDPWSGELVPLGATKNGIAK